MQHDQDEDVRLDLLVVRQDVDVKQALDEDVTLVLDLGQYQLLEVELYAKQALLLDLQGEDAIQVQV